MNAIGFAAICIGNHEFDNSEEWLAGFIEMLDVPVVSANVEVPESHVLDGLYAPYITTEVDGQAMGIIGATIAQKTETSSQPGKAVTFFDEAGAIRTAVDSLKAEGIGKIIVLSHYGYNNVMSMAGEITDIDVIVDGDSHTLLCDFSDYGLESSGEYPTIAQNADSDDVCIVQAWECGKAKGELEVTFEGDIIEQIRIERTVL